MGMIQLPPFCRHGRYIGTSLETGVSFWRRLTPLDEGPPEKKKPPRSASEAASKPFSWQALGDLKNTLTDADLQDFRARWVSSRAYQTHSRARLIADLMFGETQ